MFWVWPSVHHPVSSWVFLFHNFPPGWKEKLTLGRIWAQSTRIQNDYHKIFHLIFWQFWINTPQNLLWGKWVGEEVPSCCLLLMTKTIILIFMYICSYYHHNCKQIKWKILWVLQHIMLIKELTGIFTPYQYRQMNKIQYIHTVAAIHLRPFSKSYFFLIFNAFEVFK